MILENVDHALQDTLIKNLFDIVASPSDVDAVAKKVAKLILDTKLDERKLENNQSMLQDIFQFILDGIILNMVSIDSFSQSHDEDEKKQLVASGITDIVSGQVSAMTLDTDKELERKGRVNAGVCVSIIITKFYRGDMKDISHEYDIEYIGNQMLEMIFDEYETVDESLKDWTKNFSTILIKTAKAQAVSDKERRETKYITFTSELLLRKYSCRQTLEKLRNSSRNGNIIDFDPCNRLISTMLTAFKDNRIVIVDNGTFKISDDFSDSKFNTKKGEFRQKVREIISQIFRDFQI